MARDEGRYQIIDEPARGALARFALPPLVPFFAFMVFPLAGIPFFLFNIAALKGRTWLRELALLAVASLLRFGIPLSVAAWMVELGVPERSLDYIAILPLALSLWLAYRVFYDQSITHQIRTYFSPDRIGT